MLDFTKQYEAQVLVKGRPVTEYHHHDGNVYIEGRKGSEFDLRFCNRSHERILVIPSVDGLSVMDGKPAGLESPGYVVEAWAEISIPGWRLDDKNVAKFYFNDKNRGYAAQTGQNTGNTGVIGFLVFREQRHYSWRTPSWPTTWPKYTDPIGPIGSPGPYETWESRNIVGSSWSCNNSKETLDASHAQPVTRSFMASEMSTGFGRQEEFVTSSTSFIKRDPHNPDAMLVMYYDSARGLEKRGIDVRGTKAYKAPDAFPKYASKPIGCTPPRGWRP